MDIDISDILAEVSHHHSTTTNNNVYDTSASTDHQLLVRAWTSERCSPDLLPYPTTLITRTTTRLASQITVIEDLASSSASSSSNANLTLSILQTDLSRTQFLLRSYLRQRLAKVTRHAVHYLALHERHVTTERKWDLLSEAELAFCRSHQGLLAGFYDVSFLGGFPPGLRRLDDASGGVGMVEGPDGGAGVVVRCLAEVWGNEDRDPGPEDEEEDSLKVELRMRRGEVYVVRWRDVRRGVVAGQLELL